MLELKEPWPLNGRLDQRDPRMRDRPQIAPFGCALLICSAVGRFLSNGPLWTPLETVGLLDTCGKKGIVRVSDCYIDDWDKVVDFIAGSDRSDYLGHVDADFPHAPDKIVIDVWRRTDIDVGLHFTWSHPAADIQYDPLGSAHPGKVVDPDGATLSNSRKYGSIESRRAFQIL